MKDCFWLDKDSDICKATKRVKKIGENTILYHAGGPHQLISVFLRRNSWYRTVHYNPLHVAYRYNISNQQPTIKTTLIEDLLLLTPNWIPRASGLDSNISFILSAAASVCRSKRIRHREATARLCSCYSYSPAGSGVGVP